MAARPARPSIGDHALTASLIQPSRLVGRLTGLSENEPHGIAYRLFKVPMEADLCARTLGETRGLMKALVEIDNDPILGFTAFAPDAGGDHACLHPRIAFPYRLRNSGWHVWRPVPACRRLSRNHGID